MSFSRTSRSPSIEELYSEGPHLAAYSYETGNPNLESEYGYSSNLFAFYRAENTFLSAAIYYNHLQYFIIPRNTGDTNYTQFLPIYSTSGVAARLFGAEIIGEFTFFDNIKLHCSISETIGEFIDDDSPLPMIPPLKGNFDLSYIVNKLNFGLRNEFSLKQEKVDKFELPTDKYFIFGIYCQYQFSYQKINSLITLSIDNIFNDTYYNHLSRIKSIMPEAGLSARIAYRLIY